MKFIERTLAYFGYEKKSNVEEIERPKRTELEDIGFIQKAVTLNKKMIDEEQRRIELWTDQKLYEDVVEMVKKHFKDQNTDLKSEVQRLTKEVEVLKKENKVLKTENQILKTEEALV